MEHKLSCSLVRDLLPSYVDGLTSEETNRAVEEHLVDCPSCAEALRRMREPEPAEAKPTPEVDYLKKVRRHTARKSLLVGICLMLLGMAILGYRYLYVGSEATADEAACRIAVTGNRVTVSGTLLDSKEGVSRVTFSDSNGMVQVKLYTAPKTFLSRGEFSESYTAASDITQVRIDNLIFWENGVEIGRTASRLFAAGNPYVGDMSSNAQIAAILGVSDQFGSYTNELQTTTEPYGWTLVLNDRIASDDERTAQDIMAADSYAMLASIGNLGYVTWSYRTEGGAQAYTVTAENASAFAKQDIKLCGETATALQKLMESLSIKWSGVREVLQEGGQFNIEIINQTDAALTAMYMEYDLGGEAIGRQGSQNADNSALQKGDSLTFHFIPADFPSGTSAIDLNGFRFTLTITDADGKEVVVCKEMPVPTQYAWKYYFTLTGDYETGFVLQEG